MPVTIHTHIIGTIPIVLEYSLVMLWYYITDVMAMSVCFVVYVFFFKHCAAST